MDFAELIHWIKAIGAVLTMLIIFAVVNYFTKE